VLPGSGATGAGVPEALETVLAALAATRQEAQARAASVAAQ